MESTTATQVSIEPLVCPYCHQPVLPAYYFCPNCGTKLSAAPLSTSIATQTWIYAFSVILPMMLFIFVTKWPGLKYYRSRDPKARMIGLNAFMLIILSTIVTVWMGYVWTQDAIQSSINSINADMGSGLGS
jgi:small-conductance mechanosensitive channel